MSTQEERFSQIAAAIREKDGTTNPIKALDFASRIRAIPIGSSSNFAVPLVVTVDAGATVTATHGETTVTATSGEDGTATLILTAPGVWMVTAALGDKQKSAEIEVVDGYATEFKLSSRLPDGYTELEYFHCDGGRNLFNLPDTVNCYTDKITGKFYLENNGSSSQPSSIINFDNYETSRFYYVSLMGYGNNTLRYALNSENFTNKTVEMLNSNVEFDLDFLNNQYVINGVNLSGTRSNKTIGTRYRRIGGTGYAWLGNFFYVRQYRNNDIIHEYVPCINSNGVCGIFDVNTETFIQNTNSSATSIIPGPAV